MATQFNVSTKKGVVFETTTADIQTAVTFTPRPSKAYWFEVKCVAVRTGGTGDEYTQAASYWRQMAFVVDAAGTATLLGAVRTPVADNETAAGWTFDIDLTANVARVRVSGTGNPVRWFVEPTILEADATDQL